MVLCVVRGRAASAKKHVLILTVPFVPSSCRRAIVPLSCCCAIVVPQSTRAVVRVVASCRVIYRGIAPRHAVIVLSCRCAVIVAVVLTCMPHRAVVMPLCARRVRVLFSSQSA